MGVRISGLYLKDKKLELTHEPSGTTLRTAAPVDNQGDGSSFSPTDLFAASIGSCMLTTMAILAERSGIILTGSWFELEKSMSTEPRRVAAVPVTIHLPVHLTPDQRVKLERAAATCPVHRSVHPEVSAPVSFMYDVE